MFRVHDDQVRAFAAKRREAFEARLLQRLVAEGHDRAFDAAAVHAAVDRALARRIATEPEVEQLVRLEALAGGDLVAKWSFCQEILDDDHLTPLGKVRTILRRLAEHGVDTAPADLRLRTRSA